MANDPRFEVFPRTRLAKDEVEEGGYREPDGFGWRFRAANGQIAATSGEGFTRREDAHRAVRQFLTEAADVIEDFEAPVIEAPILDVED